jgi:hypothetical protein
MPRRLHEKVRHEAAELCSLWLAYFEIAISEYRMSATALASGRQGPAAPPTEAGTGATSAASDDAEAAANRAGLSARGP